MRLSILKNDKGFITTEQAKLFRVFFNGVERNDCEVADEEKGFIRSVKGVSKGPGRGVRYVRMKLVGKVEITTRDGRDMATVQKLCGLPYGPEEESCAV